jgi:E3 ubiquitin-protein ligase UBR7
MLRPDPVSGAKGVHSQEAANSNHYNHNFQNLFCGCGEEYDAEKEKGTMFQCLGLGTVETGGCGEDWWHAQCLMGLPKDWQPQKEPKATQVKEEHVQITSAEEQDQDEDEDSQAPPGFPHEDEFDCMICYKCVESNSWIKQYAGTAGFLPPVFKRSAAPSPEGEVVDDGPSSEGAPPAENSNSRKRKAADDEVDSRAASPSKRLKDETRLDTPDAISSNSDTAPQQPKHKHDALPPAPSGRFTLFLKEDFRERLCHCPSCFPNLLPHPQLLDDEETYEPPLSESGSEAPGSGARSHGTGSLLERGEAALSGVDRVRAIEGVMVYNNLKEKVKAFLKPYAESGQPVGAEDIKAYFEKLRGDDQAILEASRGAGAAGKSGDEEGGDGRGPDRKEQSGY